MSESVYRIQSLRDGRGPFRPGSDWYDEAGHALRQHRPPWIQEFGADAIERLGRRGEVFGTGVRERDEIAGWFSPGELKALRARGYALVRVPGVRVLAESAIQVLFARSQPLKRGVVIMVGPEDLSMVTR